MYFWFLTTVCLPSHSGYKPHGKLDCLFIYLFIREFSFFLLFLPRIAIVNCGHKLCSARSGAPWVRKFGNLCIQEILVLRKSSVRGTGVFFAWACATAEQAMCMEAHHRVCLHQNGASQRYHSDFFARWSWRMCSWFNKMCSLQKKTLTWSEQKRSRPVLTYHELPSNFISRLDLDNSSRICIASRIALTSSKSKQSVETFVDVSKHFQFFFVLKWERNKNI